MESKIIMQINIYSWIKKKLIGLIALLKKRFLWPYQKIDKSTVKTHQQVRPLVQTNLILHLINFATHLVKLVPETSMESSQKIRY